ncbi:hypothetical protein FF38_04123 [Lucilia cuprina]|uniref:Secreted protein n=1 Tax=Lucilia cuprina TaxID=7375 RepID=A0A0L0BRY2_LUCCU|nr:hypothetical protein CVS40_7382 [Lucilia cuprina]KNC22758.1 hypothetical protein FF38_04123 [Lucilia cuprina]
MKYYKRFIVTLSVLMVYVAKVKSQETTMPESTTSGPNSMNPTPSSVEMVMTTPAPFVKPDVVDYLNSRIRQVLRENPEKDPSQLNLATTFNAKRARLEAALIRDPPQEDDDLRAEQALEDFRNFMQQYNEIAGRLENAIDDLNVIEQDKKLPVAIRYEALMMLIELRDSSNIKEAERNLKAYADFKQRLGANSMPEASPSEPGVQPPVMPPLNDEYRQYFEEILRILRKHSKGDDPKMQDVLHQLLKNPEKLKKLATALKNFSEEEYEDEDYFWDWFSLW